MIARTAITVSTALAALATALAACGPAAASHPAAAVPVKAARLEHEGLVLVNARGYALYVFAPDAARRDSCRGVCAATWPPLTRPAGAKAVPGAGVTRALLGTDASPGGGRVITYGGWPLYTYRGDVRPGQASGQGLNLDGGAWYLMRPDGQPLRPGS